MDTTGAVIGPAVALLFLYLKPGQYKPLFYLAFLPGLLSVALIFLLKEKRNRLSHQVESRSFFSFFKYWNIASIPYKKLVIGLLLFALFNSSDVFLLLKTKAITGSDTYTIAAYIFYNIVYAVTSYPAGIVADRIGVRTVLMAGIFLFAVVYFLFAITDSVTIVLIAFLLYGIYAAATEGIAKAWLTNVADKKDVATAIGFYTSFQSICSLLASAIAGLLWSAFNSSTTFFVTSAVSLLILGYFKLAVPSPVLKLEK